MDINMGNVIASLASGILIGLMGIILHLLYDIKATNEKRISENDKKIIAVSTDMEKLREMLPMRYVLRDDFLRSIGNLDTKVDRVAIEVSEINKNLAKIAGEKTT